MLILIAAPFVIALALSIAEIFDFRSRPLPGSVGTCAFYQLPAAPEPEPEALSAVAA